MLWVLLGAHVTAVLALRLTPQALGNVYGCIHVFAAGLHRSVALNVRSAPPHPSLNSNPNSHADFAMCVRARSRDSVGHSQAGRSSTGVPRGSESA